MKKIFEDKIYPLLGKLRNVKEAKEFEEKFRITASFYIEDKVSEGSMIEGEFEDIKIKGKVDFLSEDIAGISIYEADEKIKKKVLEKLKEMEKDLNLDEKMMLCNNLCEIGTKEAIDILFSFLNSDNKGLQENAIINLSKIGNDYVVENCIRILQKEDATKRSMAFEILQEMLKEKKELKTIATYLKSDDTNLRIFLTDLLQYAGKEAVPFLLQQLRDTHPNVRCAAIHGLLNCEEEKVEEWLKERLMEEQDNWVISALIEALMQKGTYKSVNILMSKYDELEDIQRMIYTAILEIIQKEDLSQIDPVEKKRLARVLINILEDENFDIWHKYRAVEQIGKLRIKEALKHVLKLVKRPSIPLQIAGLRTIGIIGDKDTVKEIIDFKESPDAEVRKIAMEVIKRLESKE